MALHAGELVLCSGTLRRGIPFVERLAAARDGGFAGVSLWGRDYDAARAEGLSDADLRAMLADHGLSVAEIDPVWWWLPGAADVHIPPEYDSEDIFRFRESEMFAIARALGARSLNAVDVFGGDWSLDEAAQAFGALCRRAADHGLLVHLEFLPWSRIPDLATAWWVVRQAGEPNGGVAIDSWHYFRSDPETDDRVLHSVPGERIMAVQLSDAPARPEADLMTAALHQRLLPGEGELDLATLIAGLESVGAVAPYGVEVFSDALHEGSPHEGAQAAGQAARQILGRT